VLRVVAAIMHDGHGRVLVNQRPADKAWGGYWEFPGGKLKPGESEADCVVRELEEELGIAVQAQHALLALCHAYPEGSVSLGVHVIDAYHGTPRGAEGQLLRWVNSDALATLQLLPADVPLLEILRRCLRRAQHIELQQGS
jgi:8-oxo-dGTP diphosphatase